MYQSIHSLHRALQNVVKIRFYVFNKFRHGALEVIKDTFHAMVWTILRWGCLKNFIYKYNKKIILRQIL